MVISSLCLFHLVNSVVCDLCFIVLDFLLSSLTLIHFFSFLGLSFKFWLLPCLISVGVCYIVMADKENVKWTVNYNSTKEIILGVWLLAISRGVHLQTESRHDRPNRQRSILILGRLVGRSVGQTILHITDQSIYLYI